jgi:cytochrome P450
MSVDTAAIDLLDVRLFVERREHDAFRILRRDAPVYFNPEPNGGPGFHAVMRHRDVLDVVRDTATFSSASGTQIADVRAEGAGFPSVHNSDPPLHGKLREIGQPGFRKKRLDDLEPYIRRTVRALLDASPTGEPFDLVETISVKLPMTVISDLMGFPPELRDDIVIRANTMSDTRATPAEKATAREWLFREFHELSAKRRVDPQDDLASELAQGRLDGEQLTDAQLDPYFMVLTVAGNETTRNVISGGYEALCETDGGFTRLKSDPALIPTAVEEMVRWVSPIMQMRRTAMHDCEIAGTPIRKGAKVVAYFASANRDEMEFENADVFDVGRRPNFHVGFGQGPHLCIGAHLAKLEARVFFEELTQRFSTFEMHGRGERLPSFWFAGTTKLIAEWA